MGKNEKTILLATIVALGLSVSVSVVLAWDVNHAKWGDFGSAGTRCLAGAAGNVQSGSFYQWMHFSGYSEPGPMGAWSEVDVYVNAATYAYTHAVCKYNHGGQVVIDSISFIIIYPDGTYYPS